MKKIVKCPLCGKLQQTRGKHYFKCCQMAWEIEKSQISDYDEGRYTVHIKPADRTKSDTESLKPLIKEILQKELGKQTVEIPKRLENEDELIQKLRKDGSLRAYVIELLKERGIL